MRELIKNILTPELLVAFKGVAILILTLLIRRLEKAQIVENVEQGKAPKEAVKTNIFNVLFSVLRLWRKK